MAKELSFEQLTAYNEFESLEVLVLVRHRERWLEVHERNPEGWTATDGRAGHLASF